MPEKRKLPLHKYTKNKNTQKKHNSFATSVARSISPDDKQAYEDIDTDNFCAVSGCEKLKTGKLNVVLYIVEKTNVKVFIN